jgi:ABC-type spermidine/putrescine transport system permease subunit I
MRVGLVLWLPFSLLAAVMAYLITYEEYRRHFPERRRAVLESLRMAAMTLLFFLVAGLAVSPLLARLGR